MSSAVDKQGWRTYGRAMNHRLLAGFAFVALFGALVVMPTQSASAMHGSVRISWSGSQSVTLGDNIKKSAHRLGRTATHDTLGCPWYGTFVKRRVTFHTADWPKIDSIWTYSKKVRLPYGIRIGQRVGDAKRRLPKRFTWHGPIHDLQRDLNTRVWYAPRSHHRVLMIAADGDAKRITWAGTFASRQAILNEEYEDC
jgi:hypothetical protein